MQFLYVLLGTFFLNYFIILILNLIGIRNRRKTSLIIISIIDFSYLGYLIYELITYISSDIKGDSLFYLLFLQILNIFAVIMSYVITMSIFYSDIKIFKSKRLKNFEEAYSGKKSLSTIIFNIILFVLSIMSIVLLIVLIINRNIIFDQNKGILIFVIISILLSFIIFVGLYISIKELKMVNFKKKIMFLIYLPNKVRCFISNDRLKIEEALPNLLNDYVFDDYGYLITKKDKYIVKGIRVDIFDDSYLLDSKLIEINSISFIDAINKYEKYQRRKIYLDDNGNIIKDIKI